MAREMLIDNNRINHRIAVANDMKDPGSYNAGTYNNGKTGAIRDLLEARKVLAYGIGNDPKLAELAQMDRLFPFIKDIFLPPITPMPPSSPDPARLAIHTANALKAFMYRMTLVYAKLPDFKPQLLPSVRHLYERAAMHMQRIDPTCRNLPVLPEVPDYRMANTRMPLGEPGLTEEEWDQWRTLSMLAMKKYLSGGMTMEGAFHAV